MRRAAGPNGPYAVRRKGNCLLHLVPYSEHSSFSELREYVGWLRPKKVCPHRNLQ